MEAPFFFLPPAEFWLTSKQTTAAKLLMKYVKSNFKTAATISNSKILAILSLTGLHRGRRATTRWIFRSEISPCGGIGPFAERKQKTMGAQYKLSQNQSSQTLAHFFATKAILFFTSTCFLSTFKCTTWKGISIWLTEIIHVRTQQIQNWEYVKSKWPWVSTDFFSLAKDAASLLQILTYSKNVKTILPWHLAPNSEPAAKCQLWQTKCSWQQQGRQCLSWIWICSRSAALI